MKEHVEKFQDSGIRSICGVVDWDNGRNVKNPPLYVLGEEQGYSIETFLLDPLIVGTLLLHDELVSRESLSLSNQSSVSGTLNSGQDGLQQFADTILNKIVRESDTKLKCIERHYAGSFTLQLPLWFCHHEDGTNGHDLEDRYLEAIVPLKQKYNRRLKAKCIQRVLQNYYTLMPVVFIDLMDELRTCVV